MHHPSCMVEHRWPFSPVHLFSNRQWEHLSLARPVVWQAGAYICTPPASFRQDKQLGHARYWGRPAAVMLAAKPGATLLGGPFLHIRIG